MRNRLRREAQKLLQKLAMPDLSGAIDDSRLLLPGDLFLACPGETGDGRRHIAEAIMRGAKAVLWEEEDFAWREEWKTPNLPVRNLRSLIGEIAHELAGHPSEQIPLYAVTGTNGKTSISQWIARVHPESCAVIGTLGAGLPDTLQSTGFTTPKAALTARLLADFIRQGARACALEASSIGIEEERLAALRIDTAIFTNLSQDHLDYHGSMEAYAAAKEQLFRWPHLRSAIVNLDEPLGKRLARESTAKKITGYSLNDKLADKNATILARHLKSAAFGQEFLLVTPKGEARVTTVMPGRYNIANLLAVAAVLLDAGLLPAEIAARLSRIQPPPGRMERYGGDGIPWVAVDYAHTPDALENALAALRPIAEARQGRLLCLFGCGGNRDSGKRPQMGAIAAAGADEVWLSSDNPRFEDPAVILRNIQEGIPKETFAAKCHVEIDRAAAISQIIAAAAPEDVCLIAGRGHETHQEIAGEHHTFRDGDKVEQGLRQWRGNHSPWSSRWSSCGMAGQADAGMRWSLADIAAGLSAQRVGNPQTENDVTVRGVTTDSRADCAGKLFVALRGERFDGHDYLSQAVKSGAAALLVDRAETLPADIPAIIVADTRVALGALAHLWRGFFHLPLIALTGSNGKTTTKEMTGNILGAALGKDAVLATRGNLNNDVGLPLTLLCLAPSHRAAVIEVGMSHPGEIRNLAAIAAPTIALVTNAGRAHLEGMNDLESVAVEKGSVYGALEEGGVALINGDDAYATLWRGMASERSRVTFGFSPDCDFSGRADACGLQTRLFIDKGVNEPLEILLSAPGLHNARNALAAAATAATLLRSLSIREDIITAAVRQGLESFTGVKGRLQKSALKNGATLLDDSYNANPDSVRVGIDVLSSCAGKKILVLGDMGEIGKAGKQYHDEVGDYAREKGIDHLYTLGELSREAVTRFGKGAFAFSSPQSLADALIKDLTEDTTVLVKGSRFMAMERVAALLPVDVAATGKDN